MTGAARCIDTTKPRLVAGHTVEIEMRHSCAVSKTIEPEKDSFEPRLLRKIKVNSARHRYPRG